MAGPEQPKPERIPTGLPAKIGGYEVQRVLGTGGMATVYAALQKQPRRTVAVKVMRGAGDARTALRRFRREIEILGRLRHPYIAQVYDAGVHEETGGSMPFFVMEYVPRAKTIVQFVELKDLSIRHRLKLFAKVCAAVDHGHHRKIIHRDLKPSNILIDEAGDPRIIDFGVARAVELDLSAQTMHTEEGRLVGTIQYMSPEQLDTTRRDLDSRCDVYALGVVLFRLLTGRSPHDLEGLPVFTAAQVIRDDAPPRPSSIEPALKGDIETIVLKALEKERSRRYRNAGALGRDIIRFLTNKPIKARRASPGYRAKLFVRRHRSQLTAGAVIVLILAIAATIVIAQQLALRRQNQREPDATATSADGQVTVTDSQRDEGPPPDQAAPSPTLGAPEAFTLTGLASPVTAIAFDPNGISLAAGSAEHRLVVWSLAQRQPVITTEDHTKGVGHVQFSRDGALLATAAADGRIVLLRRDTGLIGGLIRRDPGPIFDLALHPDGERAAISGEDLAIRLYGFDGRERQAFRGTQGAFTAITFDADGDHLAAGAEGGDVYVWDVDSGTRLHRLSALREAAIAIAFVDPPGLLAAVGDSGAGYLWTLDEDPTPRPFTTGGVEPTHVAFSANGEWLACLAGSRLTLLDLVSGRQTQRRLSSFVASTPSTVAISASLRIVAIGEVNGDVQVIPFHASPTPTGGP